MIIKVLKFIMSAFSHNAGDILYLQKITFTCIQ